MKRTDLIALFAGLVFGAGLILSGMTQPSKVVGFFDLAGQWDPSLAFVMIGAIAVYAPAYRFTLRRASPLFAQGYFLPTQRKISPRLLFGSLLFGAGWAMSGFCPGPALVSAGALVQEAVLFGGGLLGGFVAFYFGERALSRRSRARHPSPERAEPEGIAGAHG